MKYDSETIFTVEKFCHLHADFMHDFKELNVCAQCISIIIVKYLLMLLALMTTFC